MSVALQLLVPAVTRIPFGEAELRAKKLTCVSLGIGLVSGHRGRAILAKFIEELQLYYIFRSALCSIGLFTHQRELSNPIYRASSTNASFITFHTLRSHYPSCIPALTNAHLGRE